jgi:hypothetical protein
MALTKLNYTGQGTIPIASIPTITSAKMPAGSVLQVKSQQMTTSTTLTTSFNAVVTGLTASITPSSSSNKILIMIGINAGYEDDGTTSRRGAFSIFKGNTNLITPTNSGSRIGGIVEIMENVHPYGSVNIGYAFLDSPATTSSTTYSVHVKNHGGGNSAVYVNRGTDDGDSNITVRGASTITLMEIAG